jgi:hypothetical protein
LGHSTRLRTHPRSQMEQPAQQAFSVVCSRSGPPGRQYHFRVMPGALWFHTPPRSAMGQQSPLVHTLVTQRDVTARGDNDHA